MEDDDDDDDDDDDYFFNKKHRCSNEKASCLVLDHQPYTKYIMWYLELKVFQNFQVSKAHKIKINVST